MGDASFFFISCGACGLELVGRRQGDGVVSRTGADRASHAAWGQSEGWEALARLCPLPSVPTRVAPAFTLVLAYAIDGP